MAKFTHGCISVDCIEDGCTFYFEADTPGPCGRAAREHALESGHDLGGVVGTAIFPWMD